MVVYMKKKPKLLKACVCYLVLALGAVSMLLPFVWMISTSLKTKSQVSAYPPVWIPNPVKWENYSQAISSFPFVRYTLNTLFVTVAVLIGTVLVSVCAGYAFARMRFKFRNQLFLIVLATMMVPGQVTMIPIFKLVKDLGWMNSYLALIVPSLCSAFSIFLMRQFFLSLPKELEAAAMVDGCTPIRTLFSIFVPLSKPAIATISVLTFMGTWNSFLWPMLLISDKNKQMISVGLLQFQGMFATNYELLMAATFLSLLPIFIIYFFAQDYFIEGIATSGMKG